MLSRLAALASLVSGAAGLVTIERASNETQNLSPIRKVITLIEEMKDQCQTDADDDLASYDKLMCWCETNDKAKSAAIEEGETRIAELSAFIEEAAAKESELKTQIETLAKEISEDQDALATATATREKDLAAFTAAETDMKETVSLLKEALTVLSKVQLLQQKGHKAPQAEVHSLLMQIQKRVQSQPRRRSSFASFAGLMQKDLFDVLGSIPSPRLRSSAAAFNQLLPWEKSEEQLGKEAKPNDLSGAAANAKSYNSRSGSIFGLLSEMLDEFHADLSQSQKEDFQGEVSFQSLKAAKLGEIKAGTEAKERKEVELADLLDKAAKADEDKLATQKSVEADGGFLESMKNDCKTEDEQYKSRVKVRTEELRALGEVLTILTQDDARDLWTKTVSFFQKNKVVSSERLAAQEVATEKAMRKLATVARKNGSWALAALAVRMRLDAFTKVKEAMDKMLAELTRQQKEEFEKKETCNKNLDSTEDEIKVSTNTQEDLESKLKALTNALSTLTTDIENLKTQEGEMEVSLKDAGEDRKAENEVYQQSITDQRAAMNILAKALKRLETFYTPGLVQIKAHSQDPGRAVSERPDSPSEYSKSGGAGGVLQLMAKIISDAESAEKEMELDEQHSQTLYSEFVSSTKAAMEANRAAQAEKTELTAETQSEKSETEAALSTNGEELEHLTDLLKAHHLDCDWILKYFDLRQQARSEEMDAIKDAKAVLSGADFSKQ